VIGISPQDLDSHERWAERRQLPFLLLADVDKKVIELYGVKGIALIPVKRSVFVIDALGIVQYINKKTLGASHVGADKLVPILERI